MENVITLGKLIGLLLFVAEGHEPVVRPPHLSILFLKSPKIQGMSLLAL